MKTIYTARNTSSRDSTEEAKMPDYSNDIVDKYAQKMKDLAREMEANGYARRPGEVVELLRAAAHDLEDQNRSRGGQTGVAMVRPEALAPFATMSAGRRAALWPEKQARAAPIAAGAITADLGPADPVLAHLEALGTRPMAAAALRQTIEAGAAAEQQRIWPEIERLYQRAGMKAPEVGTKLDGGEVNHLLAAAGIKDAEERITTKRRLERAGLF